jgi:hypothetical protein
VPKHVLDSNHTCWTQCCVACNAINIICGHLHRPKDLKIRIYMTIILPVALYECETWSLTLREEHRLRVFENRVLRRIFGQKRMR